MDSREQIALFVDLENFAGFCLEFGLPIELSYDIKKLTEHGRIVVRRSFGDIYKIPVNDGKKQAIRSMLQNNLIQHEDVRYINSYKNSSDIRLIIEALSIAYNNPTIDTFAIVADDRDFVPLFNKLREIGKNVIGIGGTKDATKEFYTSACDRFYYHGTLSSHKRPQPTTAAESRINYDSEMIDEESADELLALLLEAAEVVESNGHQVLGARVAAMMKNLRSDFDYKEYGFPSFKDACLYAEQRKLIELRESESLDFIIRCNDMEVKAFLSSREKPEVETEQDADDIIGLADFYRDFVVGKLKAEILDEHDRFRVYSEVLTQLALESEPLLLADLSNRVCKSLQLFDENKTRSVYKLLYGLYRGRSFRCAFGGTQYNPLIVEVSVDLDEMDRRFIYNTLQVYSRENRNTPFQSEAWSLVFFGDNEHIELIEGVYYND
ncbi:MAG: NYN domain-containing protein [Marinobacterium sp.]|nr:NYN domain-containing protein [Marinobacterium sp.]